MVKNSHSSHFYNIFWPVRTNYEYWEVIGIRIMIVEHLNTILYS